MRMLLLALALLSPANGATLGIGIDVLPEAFTFAARRVGFSPDLRLTACTASRCLWDLGGGVQLAADRANDSLDVFRIEATLDRRSSTTDPSASPYEKACLAIVALVAHDATLADMRGAARAIALPSRDAPLPIRIETSDRTVSLYGAPVPGHEETRRCGATAA